MRNRRFQEALGLFPEDGPPPYPDDPTAIVVSVSGGLDSDYVALWARLRWPDKQIILWHAHMQGMDWPDTQAHLEQLACVLGNCRVVIVQALYALDGTTTPGGYNGTTMLPLHIIRDGAFHQPAITASEDPNVLITLVDFAKKARLGWPPSTANRYCTSYFKSQAFNKWARERRTELGPRAVLLSGERWAESDARSNVTRWEWREDITLKPGNKAWPDGWQLLWARPGIDLAFWQVARAVIAAGVEPHRGYFDQGETIESMTNPERDEAGRARLSCLVCIYSHQHHIQRAVDTRHELIPLVQTVKDYESETGRTWQQRGPITVSCGLTDPAPRRQPRLATGHALTVTSTPPRRPRPQPQAARAA